VTLASLVRANLMRKPGRSLLLVLSVAIAFLIFGVLASFSTGFQGTDDTSGRLVVTSRVGSNEPLPIRLLERIERIEGVAAVSYTTRLRAYAGDPRNVVGASAVDPGRTAAVFGTDYALTPDLVAAIGAVRDGALVGRTLAENQGWRVGQRIALTSMAYRRLGGGSTFTFEIVGIFDGRRPTVDTAFLMVRYDAFNEARAEGRDMVGGFSVLPAKPEQGEAVARAIDQAFANSGSETRTRSEVAFMQAFMEEMADIATIITLVVGAAFATLLMIVGNTMAFAIGERTAEIGVLKTLGLTGPAVMAIVLAETGLISLAGGLIGLGLAFAAAALVGGEVGLVFTSAIVLQALALIVLVALVTGAAPAVRALRLPIPVALQRR